MCAMTLAGGNLFADLPARLAEERFDELLGAPDLRIERIVSTGHTTPPGVFLDQEWAEWVVLLQGAATLLFDGEAEPRRLERGDYLYIPAHARHRVEWTDPAQPAVWLSVHHRQGRKREAL
jgi:cupin 2 domain-containing protein